MGLHKLGAPGGRHPSTRATRGPGRFLSALRPGPDPHTTLRVATAGRRVNWTGPRMGWTVPKTLAECAHPAPRPRHRTGPPI